MSGTDRRFACTQCGKCCNRSPEVELSEAAALADVFVWRLMFRLYSVPRAPLAGSANAEAFYENKRLLSLHAARKHPGKVMRGGKPVEGVHYLMISALALDLRRGSCAALNDGRCGIHERRPLTCRTVPLHYSRAETSAMSDFDAFVGTPGYRCDTGEDAPKVIEAGRIMDPDVRAARTEASVIAARDRVWKEAIVRAMKSRAQGLPSLHEVEANARFGAMTTSMRIGWRIAADVGLMSREQCKALLRTQAATIEREITEIMGEDRRTLEEMRFEYRGALNG